MHDEVEVASTVEDHVPALQLMHADALDDPDREDHVPALQGTHLEA